MGHTNPKVFGVAVSWSQLGRYLFQYPKLFGILRVAPGKYLSQGKWDSNGLVASGSTNPRTLEYCRLAVLISEQLGILSDNFARYLILKMYKCIMHFELSSQLDTHVRIRIKNRASTTIDTEQK